MAYSVTLAGNAANVCAGTISLTNEIGQRSEGRIAVWTGTGTYYDYGTAVEVRDDSNNLVYSGFVMEDQVTKPGFGAVLIHSLTCADNHYLADKRLVFGSWLDTAAGDIVTAIWQDVLAQEGVTLGAIATGPTIPEAVFNYEQSSKAIDWLAAQAGYWWQIDQNRQLWFQPYGAQPAPFTLDGTQIDQTKNLSVTFGNRDYRNRQYAVGGKDHTSVLTETFKGDGTSRSFTLRYPVASISGKDKKSGLTRGVYLNGVAQTVANKSKGTDAAYYYAISDAVVAQDLSQTVLGTGDTLQVIYSGEYPVVALAQDASLITSQRTLEGVGTGYVEAKYSNLKLHTLSAAFGVAQAQLTHYGQNMTTLQFATRQTGITQGQTILVNLPDFALTNHAMLVRSVEITDSLDDFNIWYNVQCVGSPYDVSWQTFWQNLLNQNQAADTTDSGDYSTDSTLAVLQQWSASFTWTASVNVTKNTCPIIGPSLIIGPSVIVC